MLQLAWRLPAGPLLGVQSTWNTICNFAAQLSYHFCGGRRPTTLTSRTATVAVLALTGVQPKQIEKTTAFFCVRDNCRMCH